MPKFCAAYGCVNRSDKNDCKLKNISFHCFPLKEYSRLKQWLCKLKRENFNPNEYSSLCSEHFNVEDFEIISPLNKRRILKPGTVPSNFSFSKSAGNKRKRTSYQFDFPKNKESRSVQVQAVQRKNCEPTKAGTSDHSHEDIIDRTAPVVVSLRENGVPTIFESNFPMHSTEADGTGCEKDDLKETTMPSQKLPSSSTEYKEMTLNVSEKNPLKLATRKQKKLNKKEITKTGSEDTESSNENLKRKLETMTALYAQSQRKLRLCQVRCNHYVKQVIALEEVIDNVKKINSITDCS